MVDRIIDNFENGTFSPLWTYQETNGGKLLVHADAALNGVYGMKLIIDSNISISTLFESSNADKRYRHRFYIDPNTLAMADNDKIDILKLANAVWVSALLVKVIKSGGVYNLEIYDRTDGTWVKGTSYIPFTDGPHWFEIDWKAATAPGANDGYFKLWKDIAIPTEDNITVSVTGIDSDTESVSNIDFGAVGIDAGTSGIFYLDEFASNNDGTPIGPVVAPTGLTMGFVVGPGWDNAIFNSWIDNLVANNFMNLRIIIPDYQNTTSLAQSKVKVLNAISKGVNAIWGVSSNAFNNPAYAITSATWPAFRSAILAAASWAQANGVYEFQIGNEEEYHTRYELPAGGLVRSSNVVTVTTPVAHNYNGTHQVTIYCDDKPSFDGTFTITVTSPTTFTYANAGANEQNADDALCWELTGAEIVAYLKSVATEAQAIFTRGSISYSVSYNHISEWITAGRGDIDLLGMNVYRTWGTGNNANDWEGKIDDFFAAFGSAGYITEFSLNTAGLAYYSTDEAVQATGIAEMIAYIAASGITRAMFFKYDSDQFGATNWDETYKLLWWELLNNDNPENPDIPDYTGYKGYTKGNYGLLPSDDTALETTYSEQDISDVEINDNVRVAQDGLSEFIIHQFKDYVGANTACILEWEGQTTQAPSVSTVYLQIYNRDTSVWDTIDSDNSSSANVDFTLSGTVADLTDYKDVNLIISCRVYQEGI